jgi:hypothetical protein
MLKSLMLVVACAYINPPGLQPNAPVVQATVPEILKQAYAMEPGTQKEIIIDHGRRPVQQGYDRAIHR